MNKTIRVIPAVLTEDPQALEGMLHQSETFTDLVQIDIMDGKFVPSKSITWDQIAKVKTKIKWEVHLMVEHPENELEHYRKAGAHRAIFHYEAAPDPKKVIAAARKLGLEVGMAINPETPVAKILQLTDELDSVLFMSVHPGFYGAKYIPEVLDKVAELRKARPQLEIGIDGGIKDNNIVQVARAGANDICVGSAVFMQPDPGAAYRKLLAIVMEKA